MTGFIWKPAIKIDELKTRNQISVEIEGRNLLICKDQDKFFAVLNRCSHENKKLEGGEIFEETITCPFHKAKFCLKTGKALCAPAFSGIQTFPIRLQENLIEIALPEH